MENIHSLNHLIKKTLIMIATMPIALALTKWTTTTLNLTPDTVSLYVSAGVLSSLVVSSLYNAVVSHSQSSGMLDSFVRLERLERDVEEIKKELVILRCESDKDTILDNAIRRDAKKRAQYHASTD